MPKTTLLILGAGGHGKSVAEAALLSGKWTEIVFADDSWPERSDFTGFPIITDIANISGVMHKFSAAIPAVGNNQLRQLWFQTLKELEISLATVIHPSAILSPSVTISEGVSIMAGCIIGVNVKICSGAIVNMATSIDHDCSIGAFSHLSVGVKVTGNQIVPPLSFLKAGSVLTY